MNNRNRVRLSKLSLGLALALAAAPAFAQNTTAALGGRITGADGNAVAGATVTIVHEASGTSSAAVTGTDGRYAARGLRVGGPYTITITKDGVTEKREGVYLALAETAAVDAQLGAPAATTLETVEVTGTNVISEVFSATNMGAATSITREQIDSFASVQRNLQDYARFDPRLSQTDKDRGEISVGGQNSRFNTITIDGVNTSDTFGLEANNLPTIKQPISIDAIEAVQVNIANVDVTQRGYTGANINAVTKSGTNEFHGSLYYVYRDEEMAGDRYARNTDTYTEPAPFEETTWGFNFGGPLLKDRLFFFVSYEDFQSTRLAAEFVPFGSAGAQVFITPQQIADTIALANTGYGMSIGDIGSTATNVTDVTDKLIKLDWNINDSHRVSLRYNETEQSDPILPGFNSRGLSLSSHWYTQGKVFESLVGQWFADWTENFSTEFRASRRTYDSIPANNSRLPQIDVRFVGATPPGFSPGDTASGFRTLRFGTEASRHFNELRTDTDTLFFAGNLFMGDHEIKGGVDWERTDFFNAFLQNINGNYVFGCLLTSQCANSFESGRPLQYTAQIPLPGRTIEDAIARFELGNLGLFLQDTWSINYNWTITGGIRIDRTLMPDEPIFNVAAAGAAGFNPVTQRATGGFLRDNTITLDGEMLLQPRLGFNYTFDSERPTQIRGGIGLYQGSAANVWLSNAYSNTGSATGVFGCGTLGFAACPTTGAGIFSPNPDAQVALGATPAANVDFLHENLDQPSVWKVNLAWEHELPWWGMVVSAEYIHTDTHDGIYYQHLNLGAPTAAGTDGRNLFWTPGGYNTACFNQSTGALITTGVCAGANAPRARARNNPNFNNVMLAVPTSKGSSDNFTISLSRPRQDDDWSWSVAYSYTDGTDVNYLGSSVAYSSWIGRASFDPNAEEVARSGYVNRDRFLANLNWRHYFFDGYATDVGLFYEGRAGKPYAWVYGNDMNGDGVTGNDLLYIPTAFGSGEVVFAGGVATEQAFWAIVNANPDLRRFAGTVVERNSALSPWTNSFDVRISQELPGFMKGHKSHLIVDLLNVGNLIDKSWGRVNEVAFQGSGTASLGGNQARSFVNYLGRDAQGRYIYGLQNSLEDFVTRNGRGESAWAAQVTFRYEF